MTKSRLSWLAMPNWVSRVCSTFRYQSTTKSSHSSCWGFYLTTCPRPKKLITKRFTNSSKGCPLKLFILPMKRSVTTLPSLSSKRSFLSFFNSTAKTNSLIKPKFFNSTLSYSLNSKSGKTSLNSIRVMLKRLSPISNFSNFSENPPIHHQKKPNPSKSTLNSVKLQTVFALWSEPKT